MYTRHTTSKIRQRPGWRAYQSRLKKTEARKKSIQKFLKYGFWLFFLIVIVYGITGKPLDSAVYAPSASRPQINIKTDSIETIPAISKHDLQNMLDKKQFVNLKDKSFNYKFDGRIFQINTSINPELQNFILGQLQRETSQYIGIVVMEPDTGRILAMAGFDRNNSMHNPCTEKLFPAASVFKIITAAAAIEKCGFRSNSFIAYSGAKHTLYKSQIKKHPKTRQLNKISLCESFAQSVNPVFGRLGVHYLGKKALENYSKAFGFNKSICFEVPLQPSVMYLSDEPYQWAEVASGFNRTTNISPIHGAVMVSAIIANSGRLIEPTIVDQIKDETGHILYQSDFNPLNQAVSFQTSKIVKKLMKATIKNGTCRKAFRGYDKNPVLSRLIIGGKTGSINSRNHEGRRFDWFVGFAEEKSGPKKIVLSALVAHEQYIGIKAKQYARMIFEKYFQNYFLNQQTSIQKAEVLTN